jgi:hypothetical protein
VRRRWLRAPDQNEFNPHIDFVSISHDDKIDVDVNQVRAARNRSFTGAGFPIMAVALL